MKLAVSMSNYWFKITNAQKWIRLFASSRIRFHFINNPRSKLFPIQLKKA